MHPITKGRGLAPSEFPITKLINFPRFACLFVITCSAGFFCDLSFPDSLRNVLKRDPLFKEFCLKNSIKKDNFSLLRYRNNGIDTLFQFLEALNFAIFFFGFPSISFYFCTDQILLILVSLMFFALGLFLVFHSHFAKEKNN